MTDLYGLNRFVEAQRGDYERALAEIASGQKRTHWMWYIFPQLDGLAFSPTAKRYAIKSVEEARAYLEHPILGPRLLSCAEAVVSVGGRSALDIFGSPDDVKLKSCATLFACVSSPDSVFDRLLDKYLPGRARWQDAPVVGHRARCRPRHLALLTRARAAHPHIGMSKLVEMAEAIGTTMHEPERIE